MRYLYWSLAFCSAMLLSSCELFDYHPYTVDISGTTDINATNTAKITKLLEGRTSFKFAFISDTQRWYDETEDCVADINSRDDIDFVVHGGDFSDFGANKEFLWQRDILEELDVPYFAVIGNHDCLATGKQSYERIWGELNYAFTAGGVRFICLNTNALEYDYGTPVPDMDFIDDELQNFPEDATRTIIVSHVTPYDEQFNNNLARFYHYYITQFPGVMFSISGHIHTFRYEDIFGDGFMYLSTTCMKDRAYLIFTVTDDDYSYEEVYF